MVSRTRSSFLKPLASRSSPTFPTSGMHRFSYRPILLTPQLVSGLDTSTPFVFLLQPVHASPDASSSSAQARSFLNFPPGFNQEPLLSCSQTPSVIFGRFIHFGIPLTHHLSLQHVSFRTTVKIVAGSNDSGPPSLRTSIPLERSVRVNGLSRNDAPCSHISTLTKFVVVTRFVLHGFIVLPARFS